MQHGMGTPLKALLTRVAARAGYAVIPKWRVPTFPLASRLRQIFTEYRIERVIDAGANEGQYRDFLRTEVGFDGQIESFEPTPSLAARLQDRARGDRDWTIHPVALGSAEGNLQLNLMKESVLNSFRHPVADGSLSGNIILDTVAVPVKTLDSLFAGDGGLVKTYLKLDSQGYDLEILKGAQLVASKIPALQTEVSMAPLYDGIPNYQESIDAFSAHGFKVVDMFLVATHAEKKYALEFDCIMIRPLS